MDLSYSNVSVLRDLASLEVLIAVASIAAILGFFYIVSLESEAPVRFTVSVPDQCDAEWKGEILENPNIKVR